MSGSARFARSLRGGFLAGATVAGCFFLTDLIRLDPLATPEALGHHVLGTWGAEAQFPGIAQVASIALYWGKLLLLTALHLLAFGAATVAVVAGMDRFEIPLNIVSGALVGLVGYTMVFYLGTSLVASGTAVGLPGLGSTLVANLLGGAVMGFYLQMGDW